MSDTLPHRSPKKSAAVVENKQSSCFKGNHVREKVFLIIIAALLIQPQFYSMTTCFPNNTTNNQEVQLQGGRQITTTNNTGDNNHVNRFQIQPKLFNVRYRDNVHHHDKSNIKIVWLMSFPNSGTSFTLGAVKNASLQYPSTNYGKEDETWDQHGFSMPVYGDNGPYWLGPLNANYTFPTSYTLTKTHCAGYCMNCSVLQSVQTLKSFAPGCHSGMRQFVNKRGMPAIRRTRYQVLPEKAVHLFRNPYDNIFARFHHFAARFFDDSLKNNSREGFLECCNIADAAFGTLDDISPFLAPKALEVLRDVPCRSDFFRYAQWHNLAFATTRQLNISTHILYYEDYSASFNSTLLSLLDFLNQTWKGKAPTFIDGKHYINMYTQHELNAIKVAMQAMSSTETWKHIQHYFE